MLMYMNCSRETSILALKVPGSTRLYFQIKRGLPMKLINTPLRCDTTFSTFASTYHAMIHLTVRKLKSWLFVNFVTKGLHYFDNLGGKGRRGKQEGTGRAEMITWIYKKMYHGKSNLKHFWKLMCYIISFFCDILKRKKKTSATGAGECAPEAILEGMWERRTALWRRSQYYRRVTIYKTTTGGRGDSFSCITL